MANGPDVLSDGRVEVPFAVEVVAVLGENVHQALFVQVLVLGQIHGHRVKVLFEKSLLRR